MMLFLITGMFVFLPVSQAQVPHTFVYQGQILKNGTTPLESNSVAFTLQVISPGPEACVLYQEQHFVDMSGSNGVFHLNVGAGVRSGSNYEDTSQLVQIFSNASQFSNLDTCAGGSSYNPVASHTRRLRVSYNDGTGNVTLSQAHHLQATPYAWYAESLQGLRPTDFVQVNASQNITQSQLQDVFGGSNYTTLLSLIAGSSNLYMRSTMTGAHLPSFPADPVGTPPGAIWYDSANRQMKFYDGTTTQVVGGVGVGTGTVVSVTAGDGLTGGEITTSGTIALATGGVTSDHILDGTVSNADLASGIDASKVTVGELPLDVVPSDPEKLSLSGGTMTGTLNMGSQQLLNTGHITMNPLSTVTLGQFSALEQGSLEGVLGPVNAGATWYNSSTGRMMYWDGSVSQEVSTMATAGGDITSVTAGSGLTGGGVTGDVTVSVANGGITSTHIADGTIATVDLADASVTDAKIDSVSASKLTGIVNNANLPIGTAATQLMTVDQIPNCTATEKLQMSPGPIYLWSCVTDNDSGGDITAVNTTAPLAGGATSGAVTLTLNYDNSTIGVNGSSQLVVLDSGITDAKITAVSVSKITSAAGQYFTYTPNGVSCANNGILKWNSADSRWECGADDNAVTSVFGRSGVVTAQAGDYTATQVTNTPAGSISATTVQAALNELDTDKVSRSGDTISGALTVQGAVNIENNLTVTAQNSLRLSDSDSSNYVALRSPTTVGADYTLTLPATAGVSGQFLTTDGTGVLSWTSGNEGDITSVVAGSGLTGGGTSGDVTLSIDTGGVTSTHIADGTIATADIADSAVTSAKILDGTVSTADLADGSVTNEKITSLDVGKITSSASSYFLYQPNNVACNAGEVLKWNNDRWECGVDEDTSLITSVFGRTGVVIAQAGDYSAAQVTNTAAGNISATTVQAAINELDTEKVNRSGDTISGALTVQGALSVENNLTVTAQNSLRLSDSDSSNYVALRSPASVGADYTLTLPATPGTSGQFLTTDGTGVLSWVSGNEGDITSVIAGSGLTGGGTSGDVTVAIDNGAVTSAHIADGTIVAADIADGAITSAKILDGTIDTADIGDGVVTNAKITSMDVSKITSQFGSYFLYQPNNSACNTGEVLKWNNDRWECGVDEDTSLITSVFGRTGVVTAQAGDYVATQITNTATGDISATTVQAAINELDTEKVSRAGDTISGAVVIQGTTTLQGAVSVESSLTVTAQNSLRLSDSDSSNFVALRSPGSVGADYTLTLPATAGASGQFLTTDGTGVLSWVSGNDGDITSVTAGSGLTGGGTTGDVTIAIDNGAVTSAHIADGTVATADLADAAVTTQKLADGSVTNAKIDSVDVSKIASQLGSYFLYQPNNTACNAGEVLKWNNDRWECGVDEDTSLITSVFGRTGVVTAQNGDYVAAQITNTPAGDVAATTVQAAINELDTEKVSRSGDTISGALVVQGTTSLQSAVSVDSSLTLTAQNALRLSDSDSSHFVALRSPTTVGADYTLTLPATAGSSGQFLTTDGTGVLSWVSGNDGDITSVTAGSGLTGGGTSGDVTIAIDNDAVTSAHITDGTIVAADLADGAVTSAKILDGTIDTADLGDGVVTNAKITSIDVSKITSQFGSYFLYQPNNSACNTGEVLKWNNDRWECGVDEDTSLISSVFGRTGVVTAQAGDYGAAQITNTPAGDIAATTLQTAINELDTEKVSRSGDTISGALVVQGATTLQGAVNIENNLTVSAQNSLRLSDSDSSNFVALRSPASVGADYSLTLPATAGTSGQFLTTDGTGVLSWVSGNNGDITSVSAGSGLTGGGTSGDVTISIDTGAVTSSHIADGTIATVDIADGAITTAKLADASVTNAKIDSLDVAKISNQLGSYFVYQPNNTACNVGEVLKWNNDRWECGVDENTSLISSVFGRTGVVTAQAGDYVAAQITNTPAGDIAATSVQAAINELDVEKVSRAGDTISGALVIQGSTTLQGTVSVENNLTLTAQNALRLSDSDSSNFVALRSPTSVGADYTLTLPATAGSSGQFLTTDGTGVLSWVSGNNGDITSVTAGSGLTGGGTSGDVTVSIDTGAVTSAHIADGTIATVDIADGAITTAKLADASVTNAKIDSVDVSKIANQFGSYFLYQPNNSACNAGEVLKWNNDRWECGVDEDTSLISSVFGRTGVVTAQAGDYTATQITNTAAGSIAATTVQAAINELETEKVSRAGDTISGALTVQGTTTLQSAVSVESSLTLTAQNSLRLSDSDSSNYVALRSPASVGTNYTLTLPATAGSSGQILATDGTGVLSWISANSGDITSVTAGSGLTGGGTSGDVTLSIDTGAITSTHIEDGTIATADIADAAVTNAKIQSMNVSKITSGAGNYFTYQPNNTACANNGVLKWNTSNTRWECGTDSDTGTLTGVTAGSGLTGGGISGNPTLSVDLGTAGNQLFTNADVPNCLSTQKLQMSAGPLYTWSCVTDRDSGGDITAVNTTAPLSGGAASGAVSLTLLYDNSTIGINGSNELEIMANAVTNDRLADNSVTSAKIVDGTISATDLAANSVTTAKILDGTILTADIADAAITNAKITSMDVSKITSGAGSYWTYRPNNANCANNEVLKWHAGNERWECAADNNTGTITAVTAGAGIVGGGASGSVSVSIDIGTGASQLFTNSAVPNCSAQEKLVMSSGPVYSWSCEADITAKVLQDNDADTKITVENSPDEDVIRFNTAGTERMVIDDSGRVGIGMSAGSDRLSVFGDIRVGTSLINGCLKNATGGTIAGTCSSDLRLKRNIQSVEPVSAKLSRLQPHWYQWRAEQFPQKEYGDQKELGLIAQEVLPLFPDMVQTDEEGFYRVSYQQLPFYLLQGFGEQHQQVSSLQKKVDDLEKENQQLKDRLEAIEKFLKMKQ